jgi:hypothetical protein
VALVAIATPALLDWQNVVENDASENVGRSNPLSS